MKLGEIQSRAYARTYNVMDCICSMPFVGIWRILKHQGGQMARHMLGCGDLEGCARMTRYSC